jgi:hypothetical protein
MNASSRLRPMDLRDILDDAFDIYREDFALFVSILAIVNFPAHLLFGAVGASGFTLSRPNQILSSDALQYALVYSFRLLLGYIPVGALTVAVAEIRLGRSPSLREAYRPILSRLTAYLFTVILALLQIGSVIGFLYLLVAATGVALTRANSVIVLILGSAFVLACLIGGVVFFCLYAFLIAVFVVERKSGGAAIRRSGELVLFNLKKNVGGVALILVIVTLLLRMLTYPIDMLVSALLKNGTSLFFLAASLSALLKGLAEALVLPLQRIVYILLYFDARIRREGFDLEIMAAELERASPNLNIAAEKNDAKPEDSA